jgi:uncharacterized membrane protein YcaP (DUF421 family)
MKEEEINIFDLQRIFFGEVPASFFIEVIIRTAVIYVVLIISMRVMGQRMLSQLGRNEMAAMVSLAAAIGVPLQSPDRGLLPVFIIAAIIIAFQRSISKVASRNEWFEKLTQGNISNLVEDGKLDLKAMKNSRISKERLFAELRGSEVVHLGMVKRLYLEANGSFTLVEEIEPKPGLSIIPDWDGSFKAVKETRQSQMVCCRCGNQFDMEKKICSSCQSKESQNAVL